MAAVEYDCDVCGTTTGIVRASITLIPRLSQVRFRSVCGCIHLHNYPRHVIARLEQMAEHGVLAVEDIAPPTYDESDAPRITVAEALDAHEHLDDWIAHQLGSVR